MVQGTGQMYITGPDVIKAVTGEDVTHEELGGAASHATRSGVAQFVYDTEEECLAEVRRLLGFLPGNNLEDPPMGPNLKSATASDPESPVHRTRRRESALRHTGHHRPHSR